MSGSPRPRPAGRAAVRGFRHLVGPYHWPVAIRVKICGITSLADAKMAADAGAWAIGMIFAEESVRRGEGATAAEIGAAVRGRGGGAGGVGNKPPRQGGGPAR